MLVELHVVDLGIVADLSLVLPFGAKVHQMAGLVEGVSTDRASRASVKLEGRVDEFGLARADGSDETTAVAVFPYAIDTSNGVFTGDGFLLASRLALIWTTRIGTDGKIANQTTIQSTLKPNGYAPGLAWSGTSAAISPRSAAAVPTTTASTTRPAVASI